MGDMAVGGSDAGFTASTSGDPLPSRHGTAEGRGDHRSNDGRSSENHTNDAGAAPAAVTGSGRCPVKRMRGRPPGSKNKPKPPVIITRESPGVLRSHVLHVAAGDDIGATVASFARSHRVGVVILHGTGIVANVTVREPLKTTFTLPGYYEILSLHGCFVPDPSLPEAAVELAVCLAGVQGQIFGGNVVGPLEASGAVTVATAIFSPSAVAREWLPVEAAARSMRGGPTQGVQLLQSSVAGAGGGGGGWAPMLAPAAAVPAPAPTRPVFNLWQNLVSNNDQITDALLAESWPSATRSTAPPSN